VDFLVDTSDGVLPIEVKAGTSTRSPSLEVFSQNFRPAASIRVSAKNFGVDHKIVSIPLYAAHLLNKLELRG
jgi:hypothetical protein